MKIKTFEYLVVLVGVILLGLCIFPFISAVDVFDDSMIRSNLRDVPSIFGLTASRYWRPAANAVYLFGKYVFQESYYLEKAFFSYGISFIWAVMAAKLSRDYGAKASTKFLFAFFCVLISLSPSLAETQLWYSDRFDLLAGMWVLCLARLWAQERTNAGTCVLSFLFAAFSCMSKETMFILIPILALGYLSPPSARRTRLQNILSSVLGVITVGILWSMVNKPLPSASLFGKDAFFGPALEAVGRYWSYIFFAPWEEFPFSSAWPSTISAQYDGLNILVRFKLDGFRLGLGVGALVVTILLFKLATKKNSDTYPESFKDRGIQTAFGVLGSAGIYSAILGMLSAKYQITLGQWIASRHMAPMVIVCFATFPVLLDRLKELLGNRYYAFFSYGLLLFVVSCSGFNFMNSRAYWRSDPYLFSHISSAMDLDPLGVSLAVSSLARNGYYKEAISVEKLFLARGVNISVFECGARSGYAFSLSNTGGDAVAALDKFEGFLYCSSILAYTSTNLHNLDVDSKCKIVDKYWDTQKESNKYIYELSMVNNEYPKLLKSWEFEHCTNVPIRNLPSF